MLRVHHTEQGETMKHVIIVATAALALAACQQSTDRKFEAMCDRIQNDPASPKVGEELCNDPANVSEESKAFAVKMYERQRARLQQ
jgi:hypothetical protein